VFFVELVMQGVRGIRELSRLRFQGGFNIVIADNEAGKSTAVDSLHCMLFPANREEQLRTFVSRHVPDASRCALVVSSDDGVYYRVIQDFSKRAVNLSKFDATTREFKLFHKDWDGTQQFMAGMCAGISADDFSRVFILRRDDYVRVASRSTSSSPAKQPAAPTSALLQQDAQPQQTPGNAKLAELRETLRKSEEAADAEYRYQSAKHSLEEVQKKMQMLEEHERKKAEYDAALADLASCAKLPPNLTELIEAHERRAADKAAETDNLLKEIEGLRHQIDDVPQVNLFADKLFIAGAAAGIVSLFAGIFILTAEYAHLFPAGLILSVVMMTVAWYRGTSKSSRRSSLKKDLAQFERERTDLEKKFERESAPMMACFRQTNTTTIAALKEKADAYGSYTAQRADVEEGLQHILGTVSAEEMHKQHDALEAEAHELEKAARALTQYAVDTYGLRQDIERLEAESPAAPAPAWDLSAAAASMTEDFTPPSDAWFQKELNAASRASGIEPGTLLPAAVSAAQRNLSAITTGKYVRVEMGGMDEPAVHTNDGARIPVRDLSHATRDLVYFCLRTGLIEALAGKRIMPFIVDDGLAGFDPVRQQAACHILRVLSAKTQVLCFTSNPALKAEGDAAPVLK
jgi:hypothetical protein